MKTEPNDAAFVRSETKDGLTKREYFAAMALQGLLASPTTDGQPFDEICERSAKCADSLITQLNLTNQNHDR